MQYENRPIPGYPGYTLDSNGILRFEDTGEVITLEGIWNEYQTISLIVEGRAKLYTHHRIYPSMYKPVPGWEELEINHIDGDRSNNCLDNLEWCTRQENQWHAGRLGLTNKCIPITIMNVFTGQTTEYPACDVASSCVNISADRLVYALKLPNSTIYEGGWRIKRLHDVWLDVSTINPELFKDKTNQPVCYYNWFTHVGGIAPSQRKASEVTGMSEAIISLEVNGSRQRILVGGWSFKSPTDMWIPVYDVWIKYEQDNSCRPVICTDTNGVETIYESTDHCARAINVGKSTIHYRLNNNIIKPGRNGYGFEYYSNSVRYLGD